jgi:hypothetical protein
MNGLPFEPYWAFQLQQMLAHHAARPQDYSPDFKQICGSAFPDDSTIDTGVLSRDCTSQSPTADISHSTVRGWGRPGSQGYCSGDPLAGHLEWYISTLTGSVNWDDYSTTDWFLNDDDFNLTLTPNEGESLTVANGDSLQLEFRADESIDAFSSPFWTQVRAHGKGTLAADKDTKWFSDNLNNKFAVVTGLLGIDAVHDGKTELHPVYSMAILVSAVPRNGGIDETWEIFLLNYGVGGGCSTGQEHLWPGISDGTSPNNWYFISLPMPKGATTSSVVSHDFRGNSTSTAFVKGQFQSNLPGWVYLGFQLPPPLLNPLFGLQRAGSIDGSITIHYNVSSDSHWDQARRLSFLTLRKPLDEGVEMGGCD